jgi:hypothetical protein
MSQIQAPRPAKLIIGVFTNTIDAITPAANMFTEEFGAIDLVSAWYPFTDTTYYEKEMGSGLFRRMMAFRRLIDPGALSEIKLKTNRIEEKFSTQGRRRINIDPGYLTYERFVLATGKNYTHRIYIGGGIYADLTLVFQKGEFQTLPWTYPDYAKDNIRSFLTQVRQKYIMDIKQELADDQKHDSICPV